MIAVEPAVFSLTLQQPLTLYDLRILLKRMRIILRHCVDVGPYALI